MFIAKISLILSKTFSFGFFSIAFLYLIYRQVLVQSFASFYDYYTTTCDENSSLDGRSMHDPFSGNRGQFNYAAIRTRLEKLRETLPRHSTSDDDDDEFDDARSTTTQSESSLDSEAEAEPETQEPASKEDKPNCGIRA